MDERIFCWLTGKMEDSKNINIAHFRRSIKSVQYFYLFFRTLIPKEYPKEDTYLENYIKYKEHIQLNWANYNFNILSVDRSQKLLLNLSQDISRTIGKRRSDHKLKSEKQPTDEVIQNFAEMLYYIDSQGIKYKQGYCDIMLPIYHAFFQGLLAMYDYLDIQNDDPPQHPFPTFQEPKANTYQRISLMARALTVKGFMGLMEEPIHHLLRMPPNQKIDEAMNILNEKLKGLPEFSQYLSKSEINVKLFASRWYLLLFTQDLPLSDVIELWYELMKPPTQNPAFSGATFYDRVIHSCECAAIVIVRANAENASKHFIMAMQDTSSCLRFEEMKKTALSKK